MFVFGFSFSLITLVPHYVKCTLYSNIINVFAVTFDTFIVPLLNKVFIYLKKNNNLNVRIPNFWI